MKRTNRMVKLRYWLLGGVAVIVVVSVAYVLIARPVAVLSRDVLAVPSLSVWGRIFAVLLLAALGVAYLVWRRPVVQAQAILETSPLGAGHQPPALVDWSLYLKTLVIIEVAAFISIAIVRWVYRPISVTDTLGVMVSGAIVALVVHLLILARNSGERNG